MEEKKTPSSGPPSPIASDKLDEANNNVDNELNSGLKDKLNNPENGPYPYSLFVQDYLSETVPAGLATKKTPYSIPNWIKLSTSLDGRDKITKVIQYACRIIGWYYESQLNNPLGGERWRSLQKSLTSSRKAFRFFRWVTEWYKIKSQLGWDEGGPAKKSDSDIDGSYSPITAIKEFFVPPDLNSHAALKRLTVLGKTVGLMGFWFGDNVKFLTSSKFIFRGEGKPKKRSLDIWGIGARMYLFGAICALVGGIADMKLWRGKIEEVKGERDKNNGFDLDTSFDVDYTERLKTLNAKLFTSSVAVFKAMCDVIVFTNIDGVDLWKKHRGKKLSDGIVGLCGIGSASTVLWNNFPNAGMSPK